MHESIFHRIHIKRPSDIGLQWNHIKQSTIIALNISFKICIFSASDHARPVYAMEPFESKRPPKEYTLSDFIYMHILIRAWKTAVSRQMWTLAQPRAATTTTGRTALQRLKQTCNNHHIGSPSTNSRNL